METIGKETNTRKETATPLRLSPISLDVLGKYSLVRNNLATRLLFTKWHVFFFDVPPFEDLPHSKCTPRREELGRPTPRASGVFSVEILLDCRFGHATGILLVID